MLFIVINQIDSDKSNRKLLIMFKFFRFEKKKPSCRNIYFLAYPSFSGFQHSVYNVDREKIIKDRECIEQSIILYLEHIFNNFRIRYKRFLRSRDIQLEDCKTYDLIKQYYRTIKFNYLLYLHLKPIVCHQIEDPLNQNEL